MKTKLTILLASAVFALPLSAASYLLSFGAGADANGIQDNLGRAFRGGTVAGATFAGVAGGTSAGPGVVATGIFSTDLLVGLTASQLVSAFSNFGNTTTAFSAGGSGGNRGVFSLSAAGTVAGSDFLNQNIYLLAGNGSTLAASTQFFVFKTTSLFTAADDASPTGTEYIFSPTSGTILFGNAVADMKTTSSDATTTPGFRMAVAVPEPSAALLGAIGVLGLLRRRRN